MSHKRELPLYKLVINEDDESEEGVDFIALVDDPATDRGWQAFKDQKPYEFKADEDRQIISGPLMVANLPIFRRTEQMGEFYVVFDKETIEKVAFKFARNGFHSNVNMMHRPEHKLDDVFMFESFIIDESRGIVTPMGFDKLTEGSWFGSFKVDNKKIWDEFIKTGVFSGFSVEGIFDQEFLHPQDEKIIEDVIDIVNGKS